MGLDFELIALVANDAAESGYRVGYSLMPDTVVIKCVVADLTPHTQAFLRSTKPTSSDAGAAAADPDGVDLDHVPDPSTATNTDPDILMDDVVSLWRRRWLAMYKHQPNLRSVHTCIYIIDYPPEVPVAKRLTHANRGYVPYTQADLCSLNILREGGSEPDPSRPWSTEMLNPEFGVMRIWGQRLRLWSTRHVRIAVGKFFARAAVAALSDLSESELSQLPCVANYRAGAQESEAGRSTSAVHVPYFEARATSHGLPNLIVDGAWGASSIYLGSLGTRTGGSVVPVAWAQSGEFDIKFKTYLHPDFGDCFMVRSDDGDIILVVLAHLQALDNAGVTPLPQIWLDRTVNAALEQRSNHPYRYLDLTTFYGYLIRFRKANLLSLLALFMLRGSDYVQAFVQLCQPAAAAAVAGNGSAKRSSSVYGPKTLYKDVYGSRAFEQCFVVRSWIRDPCTKTYRAELHVRRKALVDYLISRHPAATKTSAIRSAVEANVNRLIWNLNYIYNASYDHILLQRRQSESDIPATLECASRAWSTGDSDITQHGWRLTLPTELSRDAFNGLLVYVPSSAPWSKMLLPPGVDNDQCLFAVERGMVIEGVADSF